MSHRRRILWITGSALLGVAILVLAGLFPQEPLRRIAQRRLDAALAGSGEGSARIGWLHVRPGLLELRAGDVVLIGRGWELRIPEITVRLSPAARLGRLEIAQLVARGPELTVDGDAGQAEPGEAWGPLVVSRADIQGASVTYRKAQLGTLRLEGVALSGGVGVGRLDVSARGGRWETPGGARPVGGFTATLTASPRLDLVVEASRIDLGGSWASVAGPLGSAARLAPDLEWEADLDLADGAALWPRLIDAGGRVALHGRAGLADGAWHVEARGNSQEIRWAAWSARSLVADAAWDGSAGRLTAEGEILGGRAQATAQVATDHVQAHVEAQGLGLGDIARVWRPGEEVEGTLDGQVEVRGPTSGPLDWTLDARASGRRAGRRLGAGTRVAGTWDVSTGAVEATGSVRAESPGLGNVEITGSLAGPDGLSADAGLRGRLRPPMDGAADVPFDGRLRYAAGTLDLELDARLAAGPAHLSARLHGDAFERFDVAAEGLDLGRWVEGAGGRVRLHASLSGPLAALHGRGDTTIEGASWAGRDLGTVSVPFAWAPSGIEAHPDLPAVGATGTVRYDPADGLLSLVAALDDSPLEVLGVPGLAGRVSGELTAAGPLARPGEIAGEARLSGSGQARGVPWQIVEPVDVAYRGGRVEVREASLAAPGAHVVVTGHVGLAPDAPLDGRVTGSADLAELDLPSLRLAGRLDLDLTLGGTRDSPRASGALTLADLEASSTSLPEVAAPRLEVRFDGRAAHLTRAELRIAGGTLEASGSVPLAAVLTAARASPGGVRSEDEAHLRFAWRDVDVGPLLRGVVADARTLPGGRLSGTLAVDGGLAAPGEWRATAHFDETALMLGDLALGVDPFDVSLESGRLTTVGIVFGAEGVTLHASGSADLARREIDLAALGQIQLRALSPWLANATVRGIADVDLRARGPLGSPVIEGRLGLSDASLRLNDVPQPLTDVAADVSLTAETFEIESGRGRLGGGDVTFSGRGRIEGRTLADVSIDVVGRGMSLRYPPGLRSRVDADLGFSGRTGDFELSGGVRVERGLYDLDVAMGARPEASAPLTEASPLLESIGLDVTVWLKRPILVRNNLARLDASGQLVFRGDLARPAPFGRLELLPGGQVFLQENTFKITTGGLVYDGDWDPGVQVEAQATIADQNLTDPRDRRVTASAEGTLSQPRLSLSSESLSEREVFSLVATGRSDSLVASGRFDSEARRSTGWIAGESAAVLLAGRLTGGVSRELQNLGLDEVSIQPELVARETDPGARFTFGKHLTRRARLVYSLSLTDAEKRFIQLEVLPGADVTLTGQRRDDGTLRWGAGQRLRFGGAERLEAVPEERTTLAAVRFEDGSEVPDAELLRAVRARPGRRVTEWDLLDDADRVRERLRKAGHLEAEVAARLDGADAVFALRPGPRFTWRVDGMADAPSLDTTIAEGLFEEQALDLGRERLLRELRSRGRLRAEVAASARSGDGGRELVFAVVPGPRFTVERVAFPGASSLGTHTLLKAAGGPATLLTDPQAAREGLRAAYAARRFLAAQIGEVDVDEDGLRVVLTVPVSEGPRARVATVQVTGSRHPSDDVLSWAGLAPGAPYDEDAVIAASERVRDHYVGLGYPAVRVAPRVAPSGSDVAVTLEVTEGDRVTIGAIEIEGLRRTGESLVRRRLGFGVGEPLDLRKLATAERKLLELGTFTRANLTHSGNPATVRVEVEERAILAAGYQLRYAEDDGATGDVEAEIRNVAGRGLALGARHGHGVDRRETRGSLQIPAVLGGDLTLSGFRLDEDLPASDEPDAPENHRGQRGAQVQQTLRLPDHWAVLVGYEFKRSTFSSPLLPFEPEPVDVSSLSASLLRDTRDDPLDARRGRFWSLSLERSVRALGSETGFFKAFGQAFLVHPLGRHWTWAQGYRLGLAHVYDDAPLTDFERFRAGGANSVRGFEADSLGPLDFAGMSDGGNALVVVNQELRFHHPSGLGAALFWDSGNVFAEVRDLSLDWRHSLGAGVRWSSPVGLLRLDAAFPLDKREGEKTFRIHLSLGQAF